MAFDLTLNRTLDRNQRLRPWAAGLLTATAFLLAVISYRSPIAAVVAVGGLILVIGLLRSWPYAAIGVMVTAIALTRYLVPVAGINANAERGLLPVLALVTAVALFARRRVQRPRFGIPHLAMVALLCITAVASAANAPDRAWSLRIVFLASVTSLSFFLLPSILADRRAVRFAFGALIAIGALEATFGLVATAGYVFAHVNLGVQVDAVTGAWAPYGTMWEGNVFGSFVAAALVPLIAWSRSLTPRSKGRWWARAGIVVMTIAVVASFSRGAWLGLLAGLVVVLALTRGQKVLVVGGICLIGGLAVANAVIAGAEQVSPMVQRLSPVLVRNGQLDPTTQERLYTYQVALSNWPAHPWIGWGAGALGQQIGYLTSPDVPAGISNLEIHALYDSGVLGLAALLIVLLGTVGTVYRASRNRFLVPSDRGLLIGLLGSCTVLIVAYQATDAAWLGYTWYVFGLAWTAAALARSKRETRNQLIAQHWEHGQQSKAAKSRG